VVPQLSESLVFENTGGVYLIFEIKYSKLEIDDCWSIYLSQGIICETLDVRNKIDEKKLIQRLSEGDEMAFEIIFYRYRGKVANFIKKSVSATIDWEELVMEVFMRVWMSRERLDVSKPFEAYLFRIARNLVVDELRKRVEHLVYFQEGTFATDVGGTETYSELEEKELQSWLNRVLQRVPSQRRLVFTMSRFEGMSYKEIAEKLNISENTVDTQIRRTLELFRTELKKLNAFLFLFL